MEKLAKTYIRQLGEYDASCNYLLFLVLFTIANILLYYLTKIPFVDMLLEILDGNSNLAPAASVPRALLIGCFDNRQWLRGIALAIAALLPYFISYLLAANCGKKTRKLRGWAFLPAIVCYLADAGLHTYSIVRYLMVDFSILVLFWEIVGFLLRLWFFAEMINGLVLPGKIRATKRELVSAMAKTCAEILEEDAFAKLRMQDFENMTNDYLRKINKHIYIG